MFIECCNLEPYRFPPVGNRGNFNDHPIFVLHVLNQLNLQKIWIHAFRACLAFKNSFWDSLVSKSSMISFDLRELQNYFMVFELFHVVKKDKVIFLRCLNLVKKKISHFTFFPPRTSGLRHKLALYGSVWRNRKCRVSTYEAKNRIITKKVRKQLCPKSRNSAFVWGDRLWRDQLRRQPNYPPSSLPFIPRIFHHYAWTTIHLPIETAIRVNFTIIIAHLVFLNIHLLYMRLFEIERRVCQRWRRVAFAVEGFTQRFRPRRSRAVSRLLPQLGKPSARLWVRITLSTAMTSIGSTSMAIIASSTSYRLRATPECNIKRKRILTSLREMALRHVKHAANVAVGTVSDFIFNPCLHKLLFLSLYRSTNIYPNAGTHTDSDNESHNLAYDLPNTLPDLQVSLPRWEQSFGGEIFH